jgi:hypothetical protein
MCRLIGILLVLLGGCDWLDATLSPPKIVSFTVESYLCLGHEGCVAFHWQTHHADSVSLESGYLDDNGQFQPGGWYGADNLPATGSASFRMKINNYAGRLCVSATQCMVCNPFEPDACR